MVTIDHGRLALWATVLGLLAIPATGRAQMCMGDEIENLRWTEDGAFLIWTAIGNCSEEEIDTDDLVVFDLAAGKESERFVLGATAHCWDGGHGSCDRLIRKRKKKARELQGAGQAEAEAWRAAHPAKKGKRGGASPDKKATASIWVLPGEPVQILSLLSLGPHRHLCKRTAVPAGEPVEMPPEVREIHWSPDSRYVAFLLQTDAYASAEVTVCSAAAPGAPTALAEIKSHREDRGERPAQATALATTLEGGGVFVSAWDDSQAPREQTVLFHRRPRSAAAKRIASLIPGGAEIEELTWDPRADLVIALGRSYFAAQR